MTNEIEYKFKPEDTVWFVFREEVFKGKVWLRYIEKDHDADEDVLKAYPELCRRYTIENLTGEGTGNMLNLYEDSLYETEMEAIDTAERHKAWRKKRKIT